MPGPFPGMDPYLEDPPGWPNMHDGLIGGMRALLNAALPPGYVALSQDRCYVVNPARDIVPDLTVRNKARRDFDAASSVAVADAVDTPLILRADPLEMREPTLEIVSVEDGRRVVTAIEVLSPSNKAANSKGQRLYRKKQRELLSSHTHLIEIDLLRSGQHTVGVARETLLRETRWNYLVCLHRAQRPRTIAAWPILLQQRLPRITVPLDADVPDIVLDLQAVFDRNYDEGAYIRQINYSQDPVPPLSPEDAAWADALLRVHGCRS